MPLAIWRDLLEGDDAPPAPQQIPLWRYEEEDLLNLISKTGGLLAAPEFRQWFFDVRLVWPYVDEWSAASIEERSGEQGKATLEELTNLAILDVLQPEMRRRLWRRLTRQSDLLATLGKGDLAKLAAAAARGLDAERGIPAEHHPFVRAMTLGSFMNAGLRMEIP
jgi:hypothetical protein